MALVIRTRFAGSSARETLTERLGRNSASIHLGGSSRQKQTHKATGEGVAMDNLLLEPDRVAGTVGPEVESGPGGSKWPGDSGVVSISVQKISCLSLTRILRTSSEIPGVHTMNWKGDTYISYWSAIYLHGIPFNIYFDIADSSKCPGRHYPNRRRRTY